MVSEITRFYCKPDMTSSWFLRQGVPQAILHDGFWKSDPNFIIMFNGYFLSFLNGLAVIRLFYLADISLLVAKFTAFVGKMTPKTSNKRKTLAGRALPYAKLRLLSHCVWNYLYPFGLCRCARQKGKQEGRSHKKCIFHVCVEQPLAGGMQPNLADVFFSRT